jgi:hypothetical protein
MAKIIKLFIVLMFQAADVQPNRACRTKKRQRFFMRLGASAELMGE